MSYILKQHLNSLIGESLHSINGLIYVFNTPNLEHPQQVQLVFSGNKKSIVFRCGKDGATLEFTGLPMQESNLGEYGKEVIMEMSNLALFQQYIGRTLSQVFSIYSDIEQTIVGVKLFFDNESCLIIVNIGDEINIYDSLPLGYQQDEGIHFVNVSS